MKANLPELQPVDISGAHQAAEDQKRTESLRNQSSERNTHDTHPENHDQQKIQENVAETAEDQEVQRPLGVTDCS